MAINLGFTGSRDGMSVAQKHKLELVIARFTRTYDQVFFHEGEGLDRSFGPHSADLQAKAIAEKLGCIIVPHPPANRSAEAMWARNRENVAATQYMIGCPLQHREQPAGGTWGTIRHARAMRKEGTIIWRECGCDTPLEDREHRID